MLNELGQEYVIAARAKGLSEARIIWRHALRNAMVPLVTVIALSYAGLLEGSVLTETVFAWPGLGLYITNSLLNADMNAVLGGTIVVGSIFIGLNLLSDLLYRLLDPRTRRDERRAAMTAAARQPGAAARVAAVRPAALAPAGVPGARLRRAGARSRATASPWRARDRPGAGRDRDLRRPARALFAVRRRPAHDAPAAAVGGALVRHRRPGPRHPVAHRLRHADHAARRRARRGDRRADRPRWSAPSPAISAAWSTRC